ncbi:hypothetical protein [Bacillus haynesii]|uniref:hypothetical protein n=1 Tax=Bacillus haynesii TaxID=1925021 RepID=UPI0022815BA1|nr:hypothetical protein [Bacillus haynesii]MCY7816839.1 hypothetical protein [Bacillus haynesii]MCY8243769.1 hypothetical protein [Bacillus haynesii]MCY8569607.1 hypothetical protein [Bacillus haynesii]MCY8661995.1 hypothetical protein [Bacillus haynesii]
MKLLWIFLINGIFGVIVMNKRSLFDDSGADRRRHLQPFIKDRKIRINKPALE